MLRGVRQLKELVIRYSDIDGSSNGIRDWMKKGHLPSAPYRLPAKEDKHGTVRQGRRLYSREMIEAAVEIFDKNGLLDLNKIEWSNHQRVVTDISEAWSKLRASIN